MIPKVLDIKLLHSFVQLSKDEGIQVEVAPLIGPGQAVKEAIDRNEASFLKELGNTEQTSFSFVTDSLINGIVILI